MQKIISYQSKSFISLSLIYLLSFATCWCQNNLDNINLPDSLRTKNFQDLYSGFINSYKENPDLGRVYAEAFKEKGRRENDALSMARGFHYITYTLDRNEVYLNYLDSIIILTKKLNDYTYPAESFLLKGDYFFKKRSFKDALDNYILANKWARKKNNERVNYLSNYSIGILKNRVGEHKDALKIFRKCLAYSKKQNAYYYRNDLFALVSVFYKLNMLDSATYYSKLGIKEALGSNDIQIYNYFVLGAGVTSYYKNDYVSTLDSINKALEYFEKNDEKPNLAVSYFYLGKTYYDLGQKKLAVNKLKKLDSIFKLQKDILPETREGYVILMDYYEKRGNIEKQLEYTQKLIQVDSVLNSNYKYLLKGIIKDYDTSLIVDNKDKTISKLRGKYVFSNSTLIISIVVLLIVLVLFHSNYRRRKYYQQKFNLLISNDSASNQIKIEKSENRDAHLSELNISNDIIESVISGLEDFEDGKKYVNSNYTLSSLAKELNTNSSYLSKIVNVSKGKNFSSYINELRIDYAINRLKEDKKFRKYSIKSISEEIGFKNSESFSKAFHRKTGIYPSYFIKKLEGL